MRPYTIFPRLRRVAVLICAALASLPASASSIDGVVDHHWIQVESANFRVVTDEAEPKARRMVTDLENLRYISNRVRRAESLPGPPLTIVAMGKSGFARLGLPEGIAGVFQISRHGYAALARIDDYPIEPGVSDFSRETILHEYHHFLLRYTSVTVALPRWYDEGMSEYWSSLTLDDGKAWFGHPVQGSGREYYLQNTAGAVRFDTKELFGPMKLKFDGTRVSNEDLGRFYARARYAVHYFNSSPELRTQLNHYLRLVNLGLSQDQAVRIAFKKSYDALDKDMRVYVDRKVVVRGFAIGKDGLDLPAVAIKVTPLDRPATYAVLADIVPRFTDHGSDVAKDLIDTNLKLHPDDPRAHALAFTFLDQDNASERLEALLKRFPDAPALLTLSAERRGYGALFRRATGGTDWLPQLREARDQYRKAIRADANDVRAYLGLGLAYEALPDSEPLDEGITCLDTAVIYERRPSLFHAMANLYLRKKQLPAALQSLRSSVAFGTSDDEPFDVLLMENLELVQDLTAGKPTPTATGLTFRSDATYDGPLAGGKPEGQGKWLRPNGSYYEGGFANGLPSGHGKLVSERGVVYEGDFVAGIARGQGRIAFPASSKTVSYEGGVDYARPAGNGVLVTKKGRFDGPFLNGEPHGAGAFAPAHGGAPLKGAWYFGGYDWPALDKVAFTGDIDADGQRHGVGLCHAAQSRDIEHCRFDHGRKVALHKSRMDESEDD